MVWAAPWAMITGTDIRTAILTGTHTATHTNAHTPAIPTTIPTALTGTIMTMNSPTGIHTATNTGTNTTIDPRDGLLTLVQWMSPAFPTGAFAYSHGLETAIADGRVATPGAVQAWVTELLCHGSPAQDAVLLVAGLAPGANLDALTDLALALTTSAERLAETCDQGAAMARTLSRITGHPLPPRPLPLVLAQAAAPLGVAPADVVLLYLNGFATNLVTIAVRAVPLGQSQGQAILTALRPLLLAQSTRTASMTLDNLASSAFGADLAAMAHETLQPRLYRT